MVEIPESDGRFFPAKTLLFVLCAEIRGFRPALGSVLTFWIEC